MTRTGAGTSPGRFDYHCEFVGIPKSGLDIKNEEALTWCNLTLEVYDAKKCSDYPNTQRTRFHHIDITAGTAHPAMAWTANNAARDCGQSVNVISNANPGGVVDINHYGRRQVLKYQAAWQHDAHAGAVVLLFDGGDGKQLNGLDAKAFRALTQALREESPVYYDPSQDLVLTLHELVGESES